MGNKASPSTQSALAAATMLLLLALNIFPVLNNSDSTRSEHDNNDVAMIEADFSLPGTGCNDQGANFY